MHTSCNECAARQVLSMSSDIDRVKFLSHLHVVTGKVENIFEAVCDVRIHPMVDQFQSYCCSCWNGLGILWRFNLQFTFIKNISFFFNTKILTDFRNTVETGMNPRLLITTFISICCH